MNSHLRLGSRTGIRQLQRRGRPAGGDPRILEARPSAVADTSRQHGLPNALLLLGSKYSRWHCWRRSWFYWRLLPTTVTSAVTRDGLTIGTEHNIYQQCRGRSHAYADAQSADTSFYSVDIECYTG